MDSGHGPIPIEGSTQTLWMKALPILKGEDELKFICAQRDKEIELGRFSESFGKDLLPGMYSMPIHVVPKPHSSDFCLVTNQSAGNHSLNSMIR